MASTDALPVPIKNTAYRVVFPILDADGDLVTGATGLDSEISKDQGTFTDCTNEATEIATSSGMYYLDLSSTEMNADCVAIIVKTSSPGAKTTPIIMYPQESGDIKTDLQSIAGSAVSTSTAQLGVNVVNFGGSAGTFASGRPEVNASHLGGSSQSLADLKDFADDGYDPSTNKVQGVVLTDTTTTLTNAPSDSSGVTTLLSRLTALRAGYLDNLSAGAVALASSLTSVASDVTSILGKFTGITSVAEWLGLIAGKQTGNSTARTELRATGAGSGTYDETTDSQEAIRDRGDAAWADSGTPPTASAIASQVRTELTTELGRVDAAISTRATPAQVATELATYDAPTKAELDAAVAPLATASAVSALNNISTSDVLTQIQNALTATVADSVPADGTRPSVASGIYMLVQFMLERNVSGTTLTVKKPDGSTTLFSCTLNDATTPTALTRS